VWQGVFGHDDVVEQFRRTLTSGRLASTYLFVGPAGVGKRRFAMELAHSLLCTEAPEPALAPCGQCESCRLFAAGNHPDLDCVSLPPDKSTLPIEIFIGDREHRNQEGLCHRIGLRPFFGRRKVAIVDDADHFSIPSANCLLKTLEEPPPSALLILIGTSPSRQLPTIRSRSQIVRFRPLSSNTVAQILVDTGTIADLGRAHEVAELSDGSIERAMKLADPALSDFRRQLQNELARPRLDSARLSRMIQSFTDEAGKEASLRRDRLRILIGFAIEIYRAQLRLAIGSKGAIESTETDRNDRTTHRTDHASELHVDSIDACLAALEQIDRNANLGLVIHHWSETLAGVPLGAAISGV
jgi:DNA polymerase III subunit delta'